LGKKAQEQTPLGTVGTTPLVRSRILCRPTKYAACFSYTMRDSTASPFQSHASRQPEIICYSSFPASTPANESGGFIIERMFMENQYTSYIY
jgi:hypothetical protein